MSLQSVGNTLSLQQIMQLLQQQSLNAADPEAAASGEAREAVPAGQNVPADQPQPEEQAAPGAQLAPAKPTLDPATIKTLLAIQEAQTRQSDDVLLYGPSAGNAGAGSDPLLAAIGQQVPGAQDPAPAQPAPDMSTVDPTQLQSMLAAMTGSAASGDAIASVTARIMDLLEGGVSPIGAVEE